MNQFVIFTAMEREARAVGRGAIAVGAGHLASAGLRRYLSNLDGPVIIAGVAGGLDPSLRSGSIVLARSVAAEDEERRFPDAALFATARRALRSRGVEFVSAAMLTTKTASASLVEKTELWNAFGAASADMETYLIVRELDERGLPWIALRSIVDTAQSSLPPSLRDWGPETKEREIVRRMIRRPAEWPAYAKLALSMRAAERSLAGAVAVAATARTEARPELASVR